MGTIEKGKEKNRKRRSRRGEMVGESDEKC